MSGRTVLARDEDDRVLSSGLDPAASGLSCVQRGRWQLPDGGVSGDGEGSVMGAAKKAKHEAKAAKSKTKKDAGKVKHKGKKAKNAAKH
jgi:hypothetical protein